MRSRLLEELRGIGLKADAEIDLAEAALLLGALDKPGTDLAPYRAHLSQLAEDMREGGNASDSVDRQASRLSEVIGGRYRYQGDAETYDDMRNANLIDVIDRRRGLPVALGILYLHAGRAYGADIAGLNFPSHFLIRLSARGQRIILDPFHGGRPMAAEDLRQRMKELHGPEAEMAPTDYAAVDNRGVLIRLQNNIKLRAVAAGDLARAIGVLEAMTHIAPDRSDLWWELAILDSRSGNLKRAISTLERFLDERPAALDRTQLEDLLQRLRGRVN